MAYINERPPNRGIRDHESTRLIRILIGLIVVISLAIAILLIKPLPELRQSVSDSWRRIRGIFAGEGQKPDELAAAGRGRLIRPEADATVTPNEPFLTQAVIREPEATALSDDELEALRERMGDFYVPLPDGRIREKTPLVPVKGLFVGAKTLEEGFSLADIDRYIAYVEARRAGQAVEEPSVPTLSRVLALCRTTEANAVIIDIKSDYGYITWETGVQGAIDIGANSYSPFSYWQEALDYMHEHDIYSIARIVTFKDPNIARNRPEHAIQLISGGSYVDPNGEYWVNPFDTWLWTYNIGIAQEAAVRGFDEINFDYVRFPDGAARYNPITEFPYREGRDKTVAINGFLDLARAELNDYGVHISADVFGVTTHTWDSQPEDIGQVWRHVANRSDAICPMIYPSHYGAEWYGFDIPDQNPYGVTIGALREAIERNAAQDSPGVIRPWLQAFTATWVSGHIEYTPEIIAEQIRAVKEMGIDEYLLWNSRGNYPLDIFLLSEGMPLLDGNSPRQNEAGQPVDLLGRSELEVMTRYFTGLTTKNYPRAYLLTRRAERPASYEDFVVPLAEHEFGVDAHVMLTVRRDEEGILQVDVQLAFSIDGETQPLRNVPVRIILEDGVYKVSLPDGLIENAIQNRGQAGATEPPPSTRRHRG